MGAPCLSSGARRPRRPEQGGSYPHGGERQFCTRPALFGGDHRPLRGRTLGSLGTGPYRLPSRAESISARLRVLRCPRYHGQAGEEPPSAKALNRVGIGSDVDSASVLAAGSDGGPRTSPFSRGSTGLPSFSTTDPALLRPPWHRAATISATMVITSSVLERGTRQTKPTLRPPPRARATGIVPLKLLTAAVALLGGGVHRGRVARVDGPMA